MLLKHLLLGAALLKRGRECDYGKGEILLAESGKGASPRFFTLGSGMIRTARQGFRGGGLARQEQPAQGSALSRVLSEDHVFPEAWFVKMYYFAIAFQMEMPYPLAPPQGWKQF
jgi:hypothetical protein